jgi:hypothetical protein
VPDKECLEEEQPMEDEMSRTLTLKRMADTFKLMDYYSTFFDENDPNHIRSAKDVRPWMETNDRYSKLHREKQNCSLQSSLSLDVFLGSRTASTRLNRPPSLPPPI